MHGCWLLNDALHSTILMSLELKEENLVISFESLMEKDLVIGDELVLHIRKGVCGVLDSFLSFWMKYENIKTNNMISLMLDPKFKNLRIIC